MELVIIQDDDPMDPRKDFDNLGTMICFHKRYRLGDETDLKESMFNKWAELKEHLEKEEKAVVILPLYLYDHSGITMNTAGFSCPWDSGQVGYIYATREQILRGFFDKKILTKALKERALEVLVSEVATYNQYLTGDVWGYIIKRDDGEEIESCWGFYGREDAENSGKDALAYCEKAAAKEAARLGPIRESARDLLNEALGPTEFSMDEDAPVDPVEDGAWVTCRVFVHS